jgi:hypothetical protein
MVAINFASSRLRPPTFMSAVAISRLTMPLRAQGRPLRAIAAAMRAARGGRPPMRAGGGPPCGRGGQGPEDQPRGREGRPEGSQHCQVTARSSYIRRLFRGPLAVVAWPRVDQSAVAAPFHPKLGPVEPFERNLARRLRDGCSELRWSRPAAVRASAVRTKWDATSRLASAHFPTPRGERLQPCCRKSPFPRPLPPPARAYDICTL